MADRVRRSLLFMPADNEHMIRKGAEIGPDCVIMDLEDAVTVSNKQIARETALEALETVDFGPAERWVRLNPTESGLHSTDLTTTVDGRPDGYVVPKVQSARDVHGLSDEIRGHERRLGYPLNTIKLILIIETALGVVNLAELALADQRVVALAFGAEDLAASVGATRTPEGKEVLFARSMIVTYAAAAGLQAIDTPYINYRDLDGLRTEAGEVSRLGYTGKLAIHPAQVPVIMEAFMPTSEEVERARALVAAFEAHEREGTGVFAYEGKMVDMPMLRAARRTLALAQPPGTEPNKKT